MYLVRSIGRTLLAPCYIEELMKYLLLIFLASCSMLKTYPDSPAEEWVEAAILEYSGLDIDFTSTDGK